MNELLLDIEYLLKKGQSFAEIARELEIPIHFVTEAAGQLQAGPAEDHSPYATVNS